MMLFREIYDRKAALKGGFNHHILFDHNMWNYVYFLAFVIDKNESEQSGTESYIF